MTKEEISELQLCVYTAKGFYWNLLLYGKFPNDNYAKAIFTCYFALDKVSDLTDKYLLQLPLEEPKPSTDTMITQEEMAECALSILPRSPTPITDALWPLDPPIQQTTPLVNNESQTIHRIRRARRVKV